MPDLKDRLKAVRDELKSARQTRATAKTERDSARDKFAEADHDGPVTAWSEFSDAQEAVKVHGEASDKVADLEVAEKAILEMMGTDAPALTDSQRQQIGEHVARSGGWDGRALLAAEDGGYRTAIERGVFTSRNKFGTVHLGEIADRDQAAEFFSVPSAALPAAPAGPVTSAGMAVGIPQDRRGMIPPVLQRLTFLDLIPKGTTDSNSIEYVQVQAIPGSAAPVAEGLVKPEEGLTVGDATAPVRTIAGWIKLNRQAMEDTAGLATLINTLLPYDVRRQVENQILTGSGIGQNLTGIMNTSGIGAPVFVAGDNPADAVLRAMTAVILSDADPNFVAANPLTWQDILLMRETGTAGTRAGQYLAGGPFSFQAPTLWGLALTANRTIPQGTPLVGDSRGATLLFREGVNVKTSDSDQDDFVRNRVTVLAECRVAFPVWRPASFAIADTTP